MYIRLRLKNWRSIDDAVIDLAPFTVIVGRNSSGKSNVVDALLFSSEIGRDAATAVSRRGGVASIRRWSPSKPYDVTMEVRVAATQATLDTDYVRHELVLRSGKDGAWHFHREDIEAREGGVRKAYVHRDREHLAADPLRLVSASFQIPDTTSAMLFARQFNVIGGRAATSGGLSIVRALRPVPEMMRQPQPPSDSPRLLETASNIGTALHRMTKAQRVEVVRAMRRIVPGLEDVHAQTAGRYLTLVFTQSQGGDRRPEFAATEMSDGALRALAVIVAAQQMSSGELLVIEEPEVNLHPGAADVVYDVLHRASTRGAVLVTTHSPEILDRAKDDEILVCSYEQGVTRIGPLATAQRDLVRQGLFTTAELMRSEELRREGAQPRVVQDVG